MASVCVLVNLLTPNPWCICISLKYPGICELQRKNCYFFPCSLDEVCEVLKADSLEEVQNMTDLTDSQFCRDPLCSDTLVFSQGLHAFLQRSSLTASYLLNIQVKKISGQT